MFHPVSKFRLFRIVETVYRADKVSRDPADPFEFDTLADIHHTATHCLREFGLHFRHSIISWLLVRPEPPRPGDGPAWGRFAFGIDKEVTAS